MNLHEIHFSCFMKHDKTTLRLPDSGIVVVRGLNGAGKSALMEAIPSALWDKTLRGTPWYRKGETSEVTVLVDADLVKRIRKKNKGTVEWSGAEKADTKTKAQPALDQRFGSFTAWRKTHVFSSQDADHFSMATDAERKRLLEGILGIDRFDAASKKCRADLKDLQSALAEKEKVAAVTATKIKEREAALERAGQAHEEYGEKPDPIDEEYRVDITAKKEDLEARLRSRQEHERELRKQQAEAGAEAKQARLARERFLAGKCPTCDRKLTKKMQAEVAAEFAKTKDAFEKKDAELQEVVAENEEICAKYKTQIAEYQGKLTDLDQVQKRINQFEKRDAQFRERVEKEREGIATLRAHLLDLEDECDEVRASIELHEVAEKALGIRGIRAHVLGSAVSAIETMTNLWLARLFPGVSLTLQGGDSDRLVLDIEGLEHPYGYKGASGGERRRIDVAILLALAEASAGAYGATTSGTLFFDEVMDTLDPPGIEAAAETLNEMAKDRAVLVITHNAELAKSLPARERIHVQDGRLC